MKVKYTRIYSFVFDTEELKQFWDLEGNDTENIELCQMCCDDIITWDFYDMKVESTIKSKMEVV